MHWCWVRTRLFSSATASIRGRCTSGHTITSAEVWLPEGENPCRQNASLSAVLLSCCPAGAVAGSLTDSSASASASASVSAAAAATAATAATPCRFGDWEGGGGNAVKLRNRSQVLDSSQLQHARCSTEGGSCGADLDTHRRHRAASAGIPCGVCE
ncbi:hypothetical protein K431DRAFT_43810 [Polychaeton citri CBS 116435]|uniref:Uncharacterized protein n=1 Tax=Polychaeton citri CBS 116435 TaxID=1314669 RepID=A0A9P4QD98_9PEZI|nr:hypothetical protein K431DRAFT_43810 [Polychaeton citri CBS 116435]